MTRPNIVIYISHDTGRFLSPYGCETIDTPNFETLREQSVMFTHNFTTCPLCAPARAALLTGQPAHQNGMMGLPGLCLGDWDLQAKDRHLSEVCRAAGYSTVLCGFEHETQDCLSLGFDDVIHGPGKDHNGGRSLEGIGASIGAWLDARDADKPFYMQIGSNETHREWTRYCEPYAEKGIWKAPYMIDDPAVDAEMAEMQGAANALDRAVGEMRQAFESRDLEKNTIFIFTTDHGIDFPRAKGTLFDPGIESFLFMKYDGGGWRHGTVCDKLVSHTDLYPTVLDAAGIADPGGCEGASLVPLLTGESTKDHRDTIFFEKTYHDNYDPIRGLRTKKYKYVMNFDAQTLYDVRIATAPRYNWFRESIRKYTPEELYDLEADPHETANLAKSEAHQGIVLELRKKLADWMRETADPLLEGPVPSPYHLRMSAMMKELAGK